MEKVEVRSLTDGAWYEAYPAECSITWTFGKPFVRIKFADFGCGDCELFALEHLFHKRFREPFIVAELTDVFEVGERIIGLARSETEQKWYDAEVQKTILTEDGDVLVVVEWRLGLNVHIFGVPLERKLSLKRGEVGRVQRTLSPTSDAALRTWESALRELSRSTKLYLEEEDDTPVIVRSAVCSAVEETTMEQYSPSSFLPSTRKRETMEEEETPLDEEATHKKTCHSDARRPSDE